MRLTKGPKSIHRQRQPKGLRQSKRDHGLEAGRGAESLAKEPTKTEADGQDVGQA